MTAKQINDLVEIYQRLLDNKSGKLNEETISGLLREIRDAKLEIILNRE
jgi:hypothetical protein